MNKIYKVIFNKTKGVYEVVSELAHSHSKPKAIEQSRLKTLAVFMGFLLSFGVNSFDVANANNAAYVTTLQGLVDGHYIGGVSNSHQVSIECMGYAAENIDYNYFDKETNSFKTGTIAAGHWYFMGAPVLPHTYGEGGGGTPEASAFSYIDLGTSPFGGGSTGTTNTTDLNVSGNTNLHNTTITGDSHVTNNQTVDGNSHIGGNQTIGGTTNTTDLNVSGNTNLHNTTITGDSHVTNNQTVDGSSTVKGDSNVGGNSHIGGNLDVKGDATVTGNSETKGNNTVDGNQTVKGDATVNGNTQIDKNLSVSGNTSLKDTKIDGTLETTGNATFDADAEVKGNSTVDGNSTVKGDSDVQGNGHIGKDLTVDGTSTLTGDVTTGANVTVGKDLAVKGNSSFTGNVTMNSNASIGKDLTVEGTSTLKGDVFAKSNVTIDKDLTVKGTTNFLGDINIDKDLTLGGNQTIKGDSTIHGSQQIGKDLHVAGMTQLDGNVLMGSNAIVQQNLGVGGNADIKGDLYVHDHNYIDSQGINANGYQIRNVADGAIAPGSHDAVNGGQLYSTRQALTGEINKVGAGAAALAGLHPGEFDPDNKLDFAAGYGHYKDANAAALGVFYHPNEDTTINLSGTMGNGNPMLSAGVTFKLGPSGTKTMSRTALTKQIKEDQKVIKAMADEMAAMKAQMSRVLNLLDMSKKASFSDVPADHWAKDAVDTLHGNGAIKGYPDGQFHGDKPMTRYEYAQMLYEALQKGAHVDQATLNEYAPELSQVKANNQK